MMSFLLSRKSELQISLMLSCNIQIFASNVTGLWMISKTAQRKACMILIKHKLYSIGLFRNLILMLVFLCILKKCQNSIWRKHGQKTVEILQGVMGLKRFRNLCAAIRFNNKGTRYVQRKSDKLAPLREFFESFNQNCQHFYTPGDKLTIDKKLEPFCRR
ncbi:hypothetical protein X975_12382, partial [Stegodyphus mimosarum]